MSRHFLSNLQCFGRRHPAIAAMIVTAVLLIGPAILTPFNTKGEPREAIVALSMLLSGDWILPVSFGGDIPYKPPFLAWLIALVSLPAGHVTEFTSRLPAILACMALSGTVASFARKDMGWSGSRAFAAAIATVTTVEVWRSGGVCRVDMVLTAAITCACVTLYRFAIHGGAARFAGAVALMTMAVLTKGPVGMVLPCLITAVWAFTARLGSRRLITLAALVALAAVLSLAIPAWWYIEAYSRGGHRFLDLALEENFGRMTGTMSYASHLNPWWYNLQTLAAGMLPYTLLALMALAAVRRPLSVGWRGAGRAARLAVAVCAVTLVFYTIPASKRSVYLLPMYPFLSIGIINLWFWLTEGRGHKIGAIFSAIIGLVGVLAAVALIAAPFQPWISGMSLWLCWPCALLTASAVAALRRRRRSVSRVLGVIVSIYISAGLAILPPVAEAKTDRNLAEAIEAAVPTGQTVWQLIPEDPLLRYYTAAFYMADRIRLLPDSIPGSDGWLLAAPDDAQAYAASRPDIIITPVYDKARSCDTRRPVTLYRLTLTTSNQTPF